MDIDTSLVAPTRTDQYKPDGQLLFAAERSANCFHMDFQGEYSVDKGWDGEWLRPRIVPYGYTYSGAHSDMDLSSLPGSGHYGQIVWEGSKILSIEGDLYSYRLDLNALRLNRSANIAVMPHVPEEVFIEAVHALADIDRLWFPEQDGSCLYVRPIMYATEDRLGVRPSNEYRFSVFLSPSGPYNPEGFSPVSLLVQNLFHRSVEGGMGAGKVAGNYAQSLRGQILAKYLECQQVLYLDTNNELIEETGTSNIAFVVGNKIILPPKNSRVLQSITARSIEDLCSEGIIEMEVERKSLRIIDILEKLKDFGRGSKLTDIIGLGTAVGVEPVTLIKDLDVCNVSNDLINSMLQGYIPIEEFIAQANNRFLVEEYKAEPIGDTTREIHQIYSDILKGKGTPHGWLQKVEIRG